MKKTFLRLGKWSNLLLVVILLSVTVSVAGGNSSGSQTVFLPFVKQSNLEANPIYNAIATYYYADGNGACLFGPSPGDLMVSALNTTLFNNAALCGAYVHVVGPEGDVIVRIVDWCPDCQENHLDLSIQAFDLIAEFPQGIVPITWQIVSPDISGPIQYHFKDGSNEYWTAVQIRNHRNPIAKFEYFNGNGWIEVPRTSYNYFVQATGMGVGPYQFRVTDMYGNVLQDNGIQHIANGTVNGASQFPTGP